MKKKLLALILGVALVMTVMTGCVQLPHYDTFSNEGQDYNRNIFYRNDLTFGAADPSVIAITEGDQIGYFYMYCTSDQIGGSGYQAWRSKDLQNWECTGVAYLPDAESWGLSSLWAPEVIYDEDYMAPGETEPGAYIMFYSASDRFGQVVNTSGAIGNWLSIGMAWSKNPQGPFKQWTGTVPGGIYADGTIYESYNVPISEPLLAFQRMPESNPYYDHGTAGAVKVIDASPYIDPDTGKKYLYFCHDLGAGYKTSEVWGMEMKDWHDPDYSTVVKLTHNKRTTVTGTKNDIEEGNVNEAPFMIKNGDKYYLTFSVFSYTNKSYQVRQAVGDSPLGPFTKVSLNDGGAVIAAESSSEYMSGTGHHCFVPVGNELFIVYHAHQNRTTGGGQRAIAIDRVFFVKNDKGDVVLHANGPTYSIQPLPSAISGYKNIASKAKVTVTNAYSGDELTYDNDVSLLTDGIWKSRSLSRVAREFVFNKGESKITMTFDKYTTVRAIMIMNSYYYDDTFVQIANLEFKCEKNGMKTKAVINNLAFDWDSHGQQGVMNPGAAAIAEFDELKVKEIVITVKCPNENPEWLAIPEIVVLGK